MQDFKSRLNLSAKQVKEARVNRVITAAGIASKNKVENARQRIQEMEAEIETIMDICPTASTDLYSTLSKFNATEFTDKIYKQITDLNYAVQEFEVAVNFHNSMFPDNQVEGLSEYDKSFISEYISNIKK